MINKKTIAGQEVPILVLPCGNITTFSYLRCEVGEGEKTPHASPRTQAQGGSMNLLDALFSNAEYSPGFKLDFKGKYTACHNCRTKPIFTNSIRFKLFRIKHKGKNHFLIPLSREANSI